MFYQLIYWLVCHSMVSFLLFWHSRVYKSGYIVDWTSTERADFLSLFGINRRGSRSSASWDLEWKVLNKACCWRSISFRGVHEMISDYPVWNLNCGELHSMCWVVLAELVRVGWGIVVELMDHYNTWEKINVEKMRGKLSRLWFQKVTPLLGNDFFIQIQLNTWTTK